MTTLLAVAAVIAGAMVWGVVTSRGQRAIDRRHYAAFIGFIAGVIAVTATSLCSIAADLQPHSMNPTIQGFEFVTGIIAVLSIGITFFAGVFSRGVQRIELVSGGIVVALMYLFGLLSNFGD